MRERREGQAHPGMYPFPFVLLVLLSFWCEIFWVRFPLVSFFFPLFFLLVVGVPYYDR